MKAALTFMSENYVAEEVCIERQKNAAERFDRDKERLGKAEITIEDLKQITARLDVIIERQDKQIENLDRRVGTLESKPGRLWDKLIYALIGAFVTGIAGAILAAAFVA